MSWIFLTLCSALFLGLYEVSKKSAVRDNAVLPVLFFGVLTAAVVWLPFVLWSHFSPLTIPHKFLLVNPLSGIDHFRLFGKASLVGSSWILGYFALKNLPISIAAPIRATSPLWVIAIAVLFAGEQPTNQQWAGVIVILASFYAFSFVGRREGIHFHRDGWIGLMVISTILSAASALYDKYLFQVVELNAPTVQAWFSIYLVVVFFPFYIMWCRGVWKRGIFEWRNSILLIGLLLIVADFLYYEAIAREDALISVISVLRRASVMVSFIGGTLLFGEKNFRPKAVCILGLLAGIALLYLK